MRGLRMPAFLGDSESSKITDRWLVGGTELRIALGEGGREGGGMHPYRTDTHCQLFAGLAC